MVNKELLHSLFDYQDGELYWKVSKGNKKAGMIAGVGRADGYKRIGINGVQYLTHRLVFLFHHGYLPKMLDHIDGNPSNNVIENLREVNDLQNSQNTKIRKDNTSGVKGVYWHKENNKWIVKIKVDKQTRYFGSYFDLNVAKFVSDTMYHKYHGEFKRKEK
jgi:hypothetical protein